MKINLGCGKDVREGYENYDLFPIDERVTKLDLNELPLPFKDNSIDKVLISHTLEHLNINHLDFVLDCYRILKPDGILKIVLPVRDGGLEHIREVFDKDYFHCLCVDSNKKSSSQSCFNLFTLVRFKQKYNSFKTFLWKFKHWFCSFVFLEYAWELRKK